MSRRFRAESLREILAFVEASVARGEVVELLVPDPDRGRGRYAGELVDGAVHRPWRVWVDLAERLGLRLATPRIVDGDVLLRFEPLDRDAVPARGEGTEAYGTESGFARVAKLEDPAFVIDLREALQRANLPPAPRVLDVGVNTGDELELVYEVAPQAVVVGIDHAASALAVARARFPRATLIEADVSDLGALATLARFDLVLSIGTLQSANLDDRELLRRLVQDHLADSGAIVLGIPNCRYVDGEIVYGTRMKNFSQPELGLLVKDVAFYRKYLQQHHRQVFVTGKHYVFVTGVSVATSA
jgi:SAM-dependent methyltransferase